MTEKITRYGDIGTPERHVRKELTSVNIEGQLKTRVRIKTPIDTYRNKGQITPDQLAAGEKLYNSYMIGWVGFGNCEYREPVDGGGQRVEMSDRQVDAQKVFKMGFEAAGSYWDILEKVCMKEIPIADIHKHWYPRRKEKERLRKGLTQVARVYGFC